jgi:hypothetical protein
VTEPEDDSMREASAPPAAHAVPPNPAEYDTVRAAAARRRGLPAPYVPGGHDPDPRSAEHEERRWLRLLIVMVVVIVSAGFILGFIASLLGLDFLVGNPS